MSSKYLIYLIATCLALNSLPGKIHADGPSDNQESDEVIVISNPKTPALKMRIVFSEDLSIGEVEGDLVQIDPAALKKKNSMEQRTCQTEADLIALGRRRGYKRPRLWARHVMIARKRKYG